MGKKNEATRSKYALKSVRNDPSYKRVYGNYPATKYAKGTPAMTRLSFEFVGNETSYIDIAAALSQLNRRMYRQGLYYYVNSVELHDGAENTVVLSTLPDNWVTRAAHRRGKAIFDEMNDLVLRQGSSTIVPKYHDFKVYFNDNHRTTGTTGPSLYDINDDHAPLTGGEWAYSKLVTADSNHDGTPDADSFRVHMLGDHTTQSGSGNSLRLDSVGLIKSYADTRAKVSIDPVTFDTAGQGDPLANLTDYSGEEQKNEIIDHLQDDNDVTPYDRDVYPGTQAANHAYNVARLSTAGTTGRVISASGFCAPLGLIRVDPVLNASTSTPTVPSDNRFAIILNLAVGTYNGVYAERV